MRLVLREKSSKPVPGKFLQVPHPKDAVSSSAVRAYLQTPCSLSNPIKALLSFRVPAIVAPAACKSPPSPICLLLSWVLWLPLLYSPGLPRNETHSGLDLPTPMAIGENASQTRPWLICWSTLSEVSGSSGVSSEQPRLVISPAALLIVALVLATAAFMPWKRPCVWPLW